MKTQDQHNRFVLFCALSVAKVNMSTFILPVGYHYIAECIASVLISHSPTYLTALHDTVVINSTRNLYYLPAYPVEYLHVLWIIILIIKHGATRLKLCMTML